MQRVATEPGQVLGGEEEGESYGVEEYPASFGVEALEGQGGVAGIADGDEDGNANDIQEPGDAKGDGNEEQSSFEAELVAGEVEPTNGEDEDEGEAFDAGAVACDYDAEPRCADDGEDGDGDDVVGEEG